MLKIERKLKIRDFYQAIFENAVFELDTDAQKRVEDSFNFLNEFAKDKVIYGVNTGLGPMAQFRINESDQIQLQYNLIRSHSSGTGNILAPKYAKAAMLARLNTLCLGHSGVHPSVVELIITFLQRGINPVIYEHGGVGASGDLVQLAHLALGLIGEGELLYQGKKVDAKEVFAKENLQPIQVTLREGLALMNGTSVMTGIGIINAIYTQRLLDWVVACSAAINEMVQAYDDHLSELLNHTKMHRGQRLIAQQMRQHIEDSQLTRKREQHLYNGLRVEKVFKEKVQEYYSLRCIPQILGPVLDTLEGVEKVLINEVNSANDNPIVDVTTQNVYHGGNFHGDYVALEMDKLKIAVTKMTMLAERQLNYLLNPKLNNILPPFVNLGTLGLNFGMQGVQFTATSTTAENQALSNPMYIHSIPNNNDNQDIVSMGTNAALMTKKVIENAFEVVAIELITITQAIEYLQQKDQVSSKTRALYDTIRAIVPPFKDDLIMSPYVNEVKKYIIEHDMV